MFTYGIKVYYEDTDLAGLVYYANYLKFIERARSEALERVNIDQLALKKAGLVFVVRQLVADYYQPAKFLDQLKVKSKIVKVGKASILMTQELWRDNTMLFKGDIKLALIKNDKPIKLPPELINRLILLEDL